MPETEEDFFCRNCSELLYCILRREDGVTSMKDSAPLPESDGDQKFYRCPTCGGRNLVMLEEEPAGSHYYQVVGFSRS